MSHSQATSTASPNLQQAQYGEKEGNGNNSNTDFSQTWRRRRACDRCRRYKIRCEWKTTDASICERCTRGGYSCGVSEQAPKIYHKRKRADPIHTKYAWWDSKPVVTQAERQSKLEQLEELVREANSEIENLRRQLDPLPKDKPTVIKQPLDKIAQRRDCLAAIIENGIISKENAEKCYEVFVTKLSLYVPFGIDVRISLKDMAQRYPILTMSIVACTHAVTSNQPNSEELTTLLERTLTERMLQIVDVNVVELIQALILYHMCMQPAEESRIPVYLLNAVSLAVAESIGSGDDIRNLKWDMSSPTADNSKAMEAQLRAQTYLTLQICIVATALHTSRGYLMRLLPNSDAVSEALLAHGSEIDKINVYLLRLMLLGHEYNAQAKQPSFSSPEIVQNNLTLQRSSLRNIYLAAENVVTSQQTGINLHGIWVGFKTFYELLLLQLLENAANQLAYGRYNVPKGTLTSLVNEIVQLSTSLLESFNSMENEVFPRYMYFRPLFAVTSMIRARLLIWTQNLDITIDVEGHFAKVQKVWDTVRANSVTGHRMHRHLVKIGRWMNIQMADRTKSVDWIPSNELLQKIIRGILLEPTDQARTSDQCGDAANRCPERDVNDAEYTEIQNVLREGQNEDTTVIDKLLRDLFSELT